jgi:hypothetical protein
MDAEQFAALLDKISSYGGYVTLTEDQKWDLVQILAQKGFTTLSVVVSSMGMVRIIGVNDQEFWVNCGSLGEGLEVGINFHRF